MLLTHQHCNHRHSTVICAWAKHRHAYFIHKAHLSTFWPHSSLCLTAILNGEIAKKKHKNAKNMELNRLWKGPFIYSMRAEIRKQILTSFDLSWERWMRWLRFFPAHTCLWMAVKPSEHWTGLQINFTDEADLQRQNLWLKVECSL
jgi:hypothetical protein